MCVLAATILAGCAAMESKLDDAKLETGLRFDDEGKITDRPALSMGWSSEELKKKPRDVTVLTKE